MVPSLPPTVRPSLCRPNIRDLRRRPPTVKWTLRLLATATILTVGGFIVSNTTFAEDLGLDVWNLPDLEDQVTSAAALEAEMDNERMSVGRRIDWREDIVADVLADRVTGAEAHALFLDANTSH